MTPWDELARWEQERWERIIVAAAPAIRAAERAAAYAEIRQLADSLGAGYEERQPCSCGGKLCRGILIRAHAPFAALLGDPVAENSAARGESGNE